MYTQKNENMYEKEISRLLCLLQYHSQDQRHRNSLGIHQWLNVFLTVLDTHMHVGIPYMAWDNGQSIC